MKQAEAKATDLEAVFRECANDLRAYLTRRHGGPEVAADLVQESFLQLARRLRTGQAVASPRAYLFGIARHLSLAFLRKAKVAAEPLETAAEPAAAEASDPRLEAARETIAALPALQREILDLRFACDLSYAEIATALDIPVGTVRSRLHNSVALLRERLETDDSGVTRNQMGLRGSVALPSRARTEESGDKAAPGANTHTPP
jgi:RNA polymerase sigma-70 factor, ECF subfamily